MLNRQQQGNRVQQRDQQIPGLRSDPAEEFVNFRRPNLTTLPKEFSSRIEKSFAFLIEHFQQKHSDFIRELEIRKDRSPGGFSIASFTRQNN
jgi:hypothetical protein